MKFVQTKASNGNPSQNLHVLGIIFKPVSLRKLMMKFDSFFGKLKKLNKPFSIAISFFKLSSINFG